jgi:hypothetical protein
VVVTQPAAHAAAILSPGWPLRAMLLVSVIANCSFELPEIERPTFAANRIHLSQQVCSGTGKRGAL